MTSDGYITRRPTRKIMVGNVAVGGDAPITVQSMTNTDTRDLDATLSQCLRLVEAGCEIVRVAVPDEAAVSPFKKLVDALSIPVIADIHFDYRLAVAAIESGAAAIRINPGNIGSQEKVHAVIDAAKAHGAAIRIGVNAGSLERDLLETEGVTAKALVASAHRQLDIFREKNFDNIKISLKASSVPLTLAAYREFSKTGDIPLHIGVTEAGTVFSGTIKSAVGIGALLAEGIGDTLRVSLTGDPVDEVRVGWSILKSLGLRERGPEIISCPTCGRTEIDLVGLAEAVEAACGSFTEPVTIAVMGCAVNGPGEARQADYGIAGGRGVGIIFKKGAVVKKVDQASLLDEFLRMLKSDGVE